MEGETFLWLIRHAPVDGVAGTIHAADAPADLGARAQLEALRQRLPRDAASYASPSRRTVETARALALDPDILFLDEPTAGLDPIGAAAFDTLIQGLQRSLGLTVFMVTHDLDSLTSICDRIAVLVDKKIRVGTLAQHLADPHPWLRDYFHGPRGRAALDAKERNDARQLAKG